MAPGREPSLESLACAVADGSIVDWADAESSVASEDERRVVRQLRLLCDVAAAARATSNWGPLHLRGEVGSGAFGTVYRAWDPRLEREVALKLLHPLPGASATGLVREGRLLARVRHPNVVTVFGADEHDDRPGIWMEFIEGRTLKTIVNEQGPLGSSEAGLVGIDLCRALAAVHRQGVVHRDVKAQNVMREVGGRTVLMDFGAGDALADGRDEPLRGTPAYLAPELLEGQPPDVRSDIYSLGVLLFYLVSGQFPVTAASLSELRERHAAGARTLLQDVRPDVPASFVHVVDACLAARPADRPASAGAVEARLEQALGLRSAAPTSWTPAWRRVAAAVLLAGALGAAASMAWRRQGTAAPAPAEAVGRLQSVAILPFNDLTGGGDDDYFSEGLAADLIASLSALRDLRVIAGSSTRQYGDRRLTPIQIGRELGVATVLDASVRRADNRVRIVAQLIDAATGAQIWSGSFDRQIADIVAMKSDVANRIAVALQGELSQRDMARLGSGRQYDADAFNLYLRGRHYWGLRTEEAVNRSIQYFHDAIGRDPDFAPAHAGLADAYTVLGVYGAIPREEAYARAADAAERAVSLDPALAEAHASLGLTRKNQFRWQEAEQSFKRAIELKPGLATAHQWYSIFLTQHGRFAEAIAEIKIAMSLDPLSVAPTLQFASLLTMARRFDDARVQYERALQLDSRFATAYRHMATTAVYARDLERAQALFDEYRRLVPPGTDDQEMRATLGYLDALTGRTAEARAAALALAERHERAGEAVTASIAAIYTALGDRERALSWLTRACDARDPETGYLPVDPRWDPLRGDERFRGLLRKLGFDGRAQEG